MAMNRTRRAIVILFVTALILMVLFPPIAPSFTYKPGPLSGEPFKVAEGVRPEPNKTASELSADAHATLSKDHSPPAHYRFIAIPPLVGSAAETVDYGSNIMVAATYGVAWVLFIRNLVVLLLLTGAAFLIAAPD
ncbi:MAG: hypothetical protein NTV05_03835 [Acidobacteria bacterium]|nr:hypothetical protein [Acidobacteriota bacterium]